VLNLRTLYIGVKGRSKKKKKKGNRITEERATGFGKMFEGINMVDP
jgi:hypothetical protein